MPSHYIYHCPACGNDEERYRNATKCRKCGYKPIERKEPVVDSKEWADKGEQAGADLNRAMREGARMRLHSKAAQFRRRAKGLVDLAQVLDELGAWEAMSYEAEEVLWEMVCQLR